MWGSRVCSWWGSHPRQENPFHLRDGSRYSNTWYPWRAQRLDHVLDKETAMEEESHRLSELQSNFTIKHSM